MTPREAIDRLRSQAAMRDWAEFGPDPVRDALVDVAEAAHSVNERTREWSVRFPDEEKLDTALDRLAAAVEGRG